jgi:hypothetical protein
MLSKIVVSVTELSAESGVESRVSASCVSEATAVSEATWLSEAIESCNESPGDSRLSAGALESESTRGGDSEPESASVSRESLAVESRAIESARPSGRRESAAGDPESAGCEDDPDPQSANKAIESKKQGRFMWASPATKKRQHRKAYVARLCRRPPIIFHASTIEEDSFDKNTNRARSMIKLARLSVNSAKN